MTPASDALFDEANRLWFAEGASFRALDAYRAALQAQPEDPVIAFQLARALWALERTVDAAAAFETAEAHAGELSEAGRSMLTRARTQLGRRPAGTTGFDPAELDTDVLERLGLPPSRWLDVARVAEEREMYGLAAHALARGSTFVSTELEREEHEMRTRAETAVHLLEAMRRRPRSAADLALARPAVSAPEPAVPQEVARYSPRPVSRIAAPTFEIEVAPSVSSVSDPVVLAATLRNATPEPLAVNKRLLLNNPNRPPGYGELSLAVEGPAGYENERAFNVRTGPPQPGDYVALAPGDSVRQTYPLQNYESLHVPGTYRIWVTYRNDVAGTADGRPAFLGAVSSPAVSIERY